MSMFMDLAMRPVALVRDSKLFKNYFQPEAAPEPKTAAPPPAPKEYRSLRAYRKAMRKFSDPWGEVVDIRPPPSLPSPSVPRWDFKQLFPWVFIGVPTLVTALYLALIAADRYVAESKVAIKHAASTEVGSADIGGVLTGGYSKTREDALYLKEHVLSLDMLQQLDQSLQLRTAFGNAGLDFWYRLPGDATQEEFLDYYRSRVEVLIDDQGSLLTVITEGFTPELALRLNQAILAESDKFINGLSHKIAQEHVIFASQEVERSRQQLDAARGALLALQNRHGTLDPVAQADAAGKVIAEMEAKRSQMQAELRQRRTYLNDATPQVIATQSTIKALEAQITQERSRLVGANDNKLNKMTAEYLEAKASVEFNADLYKLSLSALESARAEAIRKIKNLAVISTPQLPQEAERPQKLLNFVTLLLVMTLLYGVVRLAWAVVEDHREQI